MKDYEYEKLYRQPKPSKDPFKSTGIRALLLAVLLGFMDAIVLSGLGSDNGIVEMTNLVRVAALLTLGVVVSTVGALASFLSALRRDRTTRVGGEKEQGAEQITAEEIDKFNVRSKAA